MSEETETVETTDEETPTVTEAMSLEEALAALDAEKAKVKAANAEAAKRRIDGKATTAELEEYRKWKETQKSEVDRLQAELTALRKSQAEAEKLKLQKSVARKANLPAALADRLVGETEEEMLEDAKHLLAQTGKTQVKAAGTRGTPVAPTSESINEWFLNQFSK